MHMWSSGADDMVSNPKFQQLLNLWESGTAGKSGGGNSCDSFNLLSTMSLKPA